MSGSRILGLRQWLEADGAPVEVAATTRPAAAASASAAAPDPAIVLELERKRVLAEAEKAGYAAGMAKAQKEIDVAVTKATVDLEAKDRAAREALDSTTGLLRRLAEALAEQAEQGNEMNHELATEIAVSAVAKVLGEAYVCRDAMSAVCRQALAEYPQRPVVIRLSAHDIESVRQALSGETGLSVKPDSQLARGECRLETDKGWYDTGLVTRLDGITRALALELLGGS